MLGTRTGLPESSRIAGQLWDLNRSELIVRKDRLGVNIELR